jgi:hypothetical protein
VFTLTPRRRTILAGLAVSAMLAASTSPASAQETEDPGVGVNVVGGHAATESYPAMASLQMNWRGDPTFYTRLIDIDLGVDLIGLSNLSVPRCSAARVAEARLDCADILHGREESVPLHLLGGDRSLPWELSEHQRRNHDRITGNDSSFAYWYPATGIAVDRTTGRAIREAPGKPDLTGRRLTSFQLATAHRHIALLRHAAGFDQPAAPAADANTAARSGPWA